MIPRLLTAALVGLLPGVVRADCPSVDIWLDRAEQDIVALRLEQARESLGQAEAGFSCGPPATPAQIARFWRAEGVWLTMQKRTEDADLSFAAARRLEPEVWTAAFGTELERQFKAAVGIDDPPSMLELQPWDPRYLGWVDGRLTSFPAQLDAGLHLVQASRSPEPASASVEYGTLMVFSDGATTTLNTPFPRDAGLLAEAPAPPVPAEPGSRSSLAWVAGGAASALAGGALLWIGSRQNDAYPAAVDAYEAGQLSQTEALAEVTGTHRAQVGLGVGGGALLAVGAGAMVTGVIRW